MEGDAIKQNVRMDQKKYSTSSEGTTAREIAKRHLIEALID